MDTTQQPLGPPDRPDAAQNGDRHSWTARFRRSSRDRKVAGVAGGIGRALDIDPVLIRVAFAVLSVFGGSGVALYALAWLLMPAESDEVSGLEALLGRGRSSVSTPLAILLGIVVLGSSTSTVTWGLSLLPIAIGALLVFLIVGKRHGKGRRGGHGSDRGDDGRPMAQGWGGEGWGENAGRSARVWGEHVSREARSWSDEFSRRTAHWGAPAAPQVNLSKDDRSPADGAVGGGGGDARTAAGPADGTHGTGSAAVGSAAPPAWDPLGAAPFAWNLPEPGPAPASPEEQRRARRSRIATAAVLGLAVIVAGTGALGQFFGWWALPLAAIAGAAVAVVAVGALLSATRGRRSPLIVVGIVLAAVTAVLSVTGITGHAGFGDREWAPTGVDALARSYSLDAGDATLDLRSVQVPAGQTRAVSVDLGLGNLTVLLPSGTTAQVACATNVGSVSCLSEGADGFRPRVTTATTGAAATDRGTFDLDFHVGMGDLTVRVGG